MYGHYDLYLKQFCFTQAPEFTHLSREVFDVLTVDESENCMCMYDFIKKKPEINEFTNGHAFYELTKEEDLRYYRDIVYLAEGNTTKVSSKFYVLHLSPWV